MFWAGYLLAFMSTKNSRRVRYSRAAHASKSAISKLTDFLKIWTLRYAMKNSSTKNSYGLPLRRSSPG